MKINLGKNYTRAALFSLILLFSFSIFSFGQTEETEESPVVVPEQAMEQVVRRILIWHFKPRKQPKTIYLAAQGIQQSWLPIIKNIEFKLLSDEEIKQKDEKIYFFAQLTKDANKFGIGFAFGNPTCNYIGDYWYFRISNQRVRLWQSGDIIGNCVSVATPTCRSS